jgi:methylated-DNA-[protein]-cysteine S-methyltransferase
MRLTDSYGVYLYVVQTRLGWIGVAWSSRGIKYLELPRSTRELVLRELKREFPDGVVSQDVPAEIEHELVTYAQGQCRQFQVPVDLTAVQPFQQQVLRAIAKIPFGETRSYGWVAREIGRPKAARAVGQALHKNPIPIIIPCHRIIASDGSLGGYGGGLPMKLKLLELEGATI